MMKIVSAFLPKGYGFNVMLFKMCLEASYKKLALLNILHNRHLQFVSTS